MDNRPQSKWYFKPFWMIIAFLSFGPFALPLAWFNPGYSPLRKTIITIIVSVLSYYLFITMSDSLKSIAEYYRLLDQQY